MLFSRCKYVVVTAAPPGQPGHHHVNCRPTEYWIDVFKKYGFEFLEEVCGEVKLAARRVDRAPKMTDIWSQIQSEIEQATVVISVFTRGRFGSMPNPNVITEAAHEDAERPRHVDAARSVNDRRSVVG